MLSSFVRDTASFLSAGAEVALAGRVFELEGGHVTWIKIVERIAIVWSVWTRDCEGNER